MDGNPISTLTVSNGSGVSFFRGRFEALQFPKLAASTN
jgi:hypothetical protein